MHNIFVELSKPVVSIPLCVVAILCGLSASALVIAFRALIFASHSLYLPQFSDYANGEWYTLITAPIAGALIFALIAKLNGSRYYRVGIPYIYHRMKYYYGNIELRTTINQFFGGWMALASGFVVGKEGPTVHLGAAATNFISRWFGFPHNCQRILTGCGIAAGISAAFNTPIAAVIFVMEVVMKEYKTHIFVPVLLAASIGAVTSRMVFGSATELMFLEIEALDISNLVSLIVLGLCAGIVGGLFNRGLTTIMTHAKPWSLTSRLMLAATFTAIVGAFLPQALGGDLIQVERLLQQPVTLELISILFVCKLVLSMVALGLGVPGGIIGASMTIGVYMGLAIGCLAGLLYPESMSLHAFALFGLAGVLCSVMMAPMAALSAAFELSHSTHAIMPGIIVVVVSYLTATKLLANRSIVYQQLEILGLQYRTSILQEVMQRTGVMAVMRTDGLSAIKATQSAKLNDQANIKQQACIFEAQQRLTQLMALNSPIERLLVVDDKQQVVGYLTQEHITTYLETRQEDAN